MNKYVSKLASGAAAAYLLTTVGCQNAPPAASNAVKSNTVAVSNSANSDHEEIEAREPEQYKATMEMTASAIGSKSNVKLPALYADVARSGSQRRVEFNLPGGEKVVYLNRDGVKYFVLPNRKQYVELQPEARGFQLPALMMPDQLVDHLKNRRGYRRLDHDEQYKGRTVVKYATAGSTETNSAAGTLTGESIVFVDKESGLPIRSEFQSRASNDVQGVEGMTVVVEMRDIQETVSSEMFQVPEGFQKVTEQEIQDRINNVMNVAVAIGGALLRNMNTAPTPDSTRPEPAN